MKFTILDEYEVPKANAKPKSAQPEHVPSEKPKKKIPYERLIGIIDNVGNKLARDEKLSPEDKLTQWVDLLLWVLPHIPDDEQHMKANLTQSINNPSQWDFMKKPEGKRDV